MLVTGKYILNMYPKIAHYILSPIENKGYAYTKSHHTSIIEVFCKNFSRLHIIRGEEYKYSIDSINEHSCYYCARYLYRGCICFIKYARRNGRICYMANGIGRYRCVKNSTPEIKTIIKLTYQKEWLLKLISK